MLRASALAPNKVIHRLLQPAIKAFLVHDPIEEANAEQGVLCATAAIPADIIGSIPASGLRRGQQCKGFVTI